MLIACNHQETDGLALVHMLREQTTIQGWAKCPGRSVETHHPFLTKALQAEVIIQHLPISVYRFV